MVRRQTWLGLVLLLTAVVALCAWKGWENRRHQRAISEINAQMAAGRHAIAARNLTQLLVSGSDPDEAAYLLGVCELARGRPQDAAQAWARVTPGSSFSSRAIEARMSLFANKGLFGAAEQVIEEAARDRRNDRSALRILLVPTLTIEGRLLEALRLVEERWDHLRVTGEETSELAINLARLHFELQSKPYPLDVALGQLEQAARLAPDDDRVWLGRANLAIRAGNVEEAEHWLDACRRSRPNDTPVWSARLSWAMAAGRIDVVRQALTHIPATASSPAQVHRITAWLAAKEGNAAKEREALERLLAAEPTDLTAFRRLAELGPLKRVPKLHEREAEINRLTARYQKLYDRNQPIRDANEMGALAEKLGRVFEAKVFLSVAAAESLNRGPARLSLERLNRQVVSLEASKKPLAEIVTATTGDRTKTE